MDYTQLIEKLLNDHRLEILDWDNLPIAADALAALQARVTILELDRIGADREIRGLDDLATKVKAERDSALAKLAALEGQDKEPAAYEFRMRADWIADWGLWSPCNKEQHEMYIRVPKLHDWHYETRALYLAVGAQAQPLTGDQMNQVRIDAGIAGSEMMTDILYAFARAVEKAHGIGGSV
jgi:hypothetical protein